MILILDVVKMRGSHYMVPTRYFSKTGTNKFVRAYSSAKGLSRPLTLGQAHLALPIQYKPIAVAFSSKASSASALSKNQSTSAHPLTASATFALVSECEKSPASYGVLLYDGLAPEPPSLSASSAKNPSTNALVPEPAQAPASTDPGTYHEMIRWNTPLPFTATGKFETAPGTDYWSAGAITIACRQSPFDLPIPLATLELDGIRMAPAGVSKAKVTIRLDQHLRGKVLIRDTYTRAYAECTFNGDLFSIDQARVKEVGSDAAEQDHPLLG